MKYAAAAPAICCHHPREYEILHPLTQAAAAPSDIPATDKTNNNMIVATVSLNRDLCVLLLNLCYRSCSCKCDPIVGANMCKD